MAPPMTLRNVSQDGLEERRRAPRATATGAIFLLVFKGSTSAEPDPGHCRPSCPVPFPPFPSRGVSVRAPRAAPRGRHSHRGLDSHAPHCARRRGPPGWHCCAPVWTTEGAVRVALRLEGLACGPSPAGEVPRVLGVPTAVRLGGAHGRRCAANAGPDPISHGHGVPRRGGYYTG